MTDPCPKCVACPMAGSIYTYYECAGDATCPRRPAETATAGINLDRARSRLHDILDYVRNKDDLYAGGAIRRLAEEALVAVDPTERLDVPGFTGSDGKAVLS